MAGYIVENIKNGVVKQWYYEDVEKLPRDGSVTLLDVRTPAEYARGHVEGFVNIAVDEMSEHIDNLERPEKLYRMSDSDWQRV